MGVSQGTAILLASLLSFCAVWIFRFVAKHFGVLTDNPNPRSNHSTPTVRGAGIIFASFVTLPALAAGFRAPSIAALGFAGGGLLLACIGFLEDFKGLSIRTRLLAYLGASLIPVFVVAQGPFSILGLSSICLLSFLILIFLLASINIYNFMDGIDGLVASNSLLALVVFALANQGFPVSASFFFAVPIGALAGFLIHNWHPAKVFMGDVGSTFLGYMLACFALTGPAVTGDPHDLILMLFLMSPMLFDATYTLIRRALRGEKVYTAHSTHLYQRLVRSGFSHSRVSVIYLGLTSVGTLLSFWALRGGAGLVAAPIFMLASLILFTTWVERTVSRAAPQSA